MSQHRRDFFRKGAMLAAGGLLAAGVTAEPADAEAMTTFSRYQPSRGGSPESRTGQRRPPRRARQAATSRHR